MHNPDLSGDTSIITELSADALTDAAIVEHLKQCRDFARDIGSRHFPSFWRAWSEQIRDEGDAARSNREQLALYETYNLLVAVQSAAEQEFVQHIANGFVKFKQKTLNTLTGAEQFSGDILSLVDHADLEETIAINSIVKRAENHYADMLWALSQRLALLNHGEKITDAKNPASPVQFCESLRKLLSSLDITVKTKLMGYKLFEEMVIAHLDDLYSTINTYLIEQHFLPNLRFVGGEHGSDGRASGSNKVGQVVSERASDLTDDNAASVDTAVETFQRRASDKLVNGALTPEDVQYQTSLLSAIRVLQAHVSHQMPAVYAANNVGAVLPAGRAPAHGNAAAQPLQVYSTHQLVNVFETLQAQALTQQGSVATNSPKHAVSVPDVAALNRQLFQHIADENQRAALGSTDMQTIDLVGMLFEYMLSDEQLPDSVKALLSYLHTPFLKIAFIDTDFFEKPEHPARILLNNLAEAGIRWVSNDGSDQYDIFAKIKQTVFHILQEFKNDVRIFAESLIAFNAYTNNVARRQELMERRILEKVQGEEKLREAKIVVNREVRTRTNMREMPSAVLLLLLQPWSDYLSFVFLRYGEHSEVWKKGLQTIEDLLWALEPKTTPLEKTRQLELNESVMVMLERGFETIGYDQAKARKLLDAVSSLLRMAIMSRKAEPAPAPMRTKLESLADEKAGRPLVREEPVLPEEEKIVASLQMVEFGTWLEFEGGKRLKVAWYNKKTEHYMLVDQQGKNVSLMASLQLAREMLAGKAKIIAGSSKPFFERALENIYQTLHERAETTANAGEVPSELAGDRDDQ